MPLTIEKIFIPSAGVELVAEIDSLYPISWSSIIYDVNHDKTAITIAYPDKLNPTHLKGIKKLHITSKFNQNGAIIRVGIACTRCEIIKSYPLANGTRVKAIYLRYKPPVTKTNIRAAYRLSLTNRYPVKAKLRHKNTEYQLPRYFKIKDISLSGIALLLPIGIQQKKNPLTGIKLNEQVSMGIKVGIGSMQNNSRTIYFKARAKRINQNINTKKVLIAFKITSITNENELLLTQFIHNAQIDELQKLRLGNSQ